MKIKICGLRRIEDIDAVNEAKPDYAGFILSEGFRRSIDLTTMRELKKRLSKEISAVGVFVNEDPDRISKLLLEGIIDLAQLHGNEPEEEVIRIRENARKPVIKYVKAADTAQIEGWLGSSADYLLFDSGTGTGKTFDWSVLGGIERPFFLAGGLSAENLEEAYHRVNPFAADLSSGVETDGWKDRDKILQAVKKVRSL
ncbi:MAG: phosphoribosylanthranilate isomerase [Lachnospiraceae bacterium]|nr:phosphoribosylanthranilate isomerase [Lachnospiraceae bacterium]